MSSCPNHLRHNTVPELTTSASKIISVTTVRLECMIVPEMTPVLLRNPQEGRVFGMIWYDIISVDTRF